MVDLFLQSAHLGEQLVVISFGVSELFRDFVEPIDLGHGFFDAEFDVLQNRLVLVEARLLRQDSDRITRRKNRITIGRLV